MPNLFQPIRPIPETSSGYENFLRYLGDVGAFSNLADTGIYKWVDNPRLKDFKSPGPKNMHKLAGRQVTEIIKDPSITKDVPTIAKSRVARHPSQADATTHFNRFGPQTEIAFADKLTPYWEANRTLVHELDHVAKSQQEFDNTLARRPTDFFDNKTKKVIPAELYWSETGAGKPDLYDRGTHEIMAYSAEENNPRMSATRKGNGTAVMPNEQVHPIYKKWMQNTSKFPSGMNGALGALGVPFQVMDTNRLQKNVQQDGPAAGYAKWLGLETKDPTKDYE